MNAPLVAVVLAGGEGRRMGGQKPLRRLDGVTLIDRAVNLARSYAPRLAVAVRDPGQVGEDLGAPLVFDAPGLGGPLAGLAAGLAFARSASARRLLTLPCDMPCLPADLLRRLDAALQPPARVAIATCAGRLHPVCALWDVGVADDLPGYVADGRSSVRGFAQQVGMATATWAEEFESAFANVNSPADLDVLEALVRA